MDPDVTRLRAIQDALVDAELPAVVVDLQIFDENTMRIASEAQKSNADLRIRLASKSLRVPSLMHRALAAHSAYQGLMCFAAAEIPFLAAQGFDDFLLAYPTLQPKALAALAACAKTHRISVVVDSQAGIEATAKAAREADSQIGCVLELDVSWRVPGMPPIGSRRSPLRHVKDLEKKVKEIQEHESLRFVGVMAYEGQVAGVPDESPHKGFLENIGLQGLRHREARRVARVRGQILKEISRQGISCEIVNGGGSGSVSFAAKENVLTELGVGSALLAPHLFTSYSNLAVRPALYVALEAVRSSESGWVTCGGGGYVASGAPGWDRLLMPVFPERAKLSPLEGCGEVQTPLRTREPIALGTPCLFRPAKAGEISERFSRYWLWDGAQLVATPTYRGLGACFL